MELEDLKTTDTWNLYERGRNYNSMLGMYTDTDRNHRMYNGDQWNGLQVESIEPVQLNFIKPIVDYKVSTINANLWAINFSSENFEDRNFRETAEETCKLLNKKAANIWEQDKMDSKIRRVSKDSAIDDESAIYAEYDKEKQTMYNEILNKTDIIYGNENNSEIEQQPYIIIKQRKTVFEIRDIAKANGVGEEKLCFIVGDSDVFEEAGDTAKYEKDNNCTILTKLWKENGKVWFSKSTKYCEIKKATNSGLNLYPIAHMLWTEKKGSARGEGEVKHLIPNQLETNKILMRSALVVKQTAYPQKVVNMDKIQNPDAVGQVGGIIKTKNGSTIEDVSKIFSHINPAQMSSDVERLRTQLIEESRNLANASDAASGNIDQTTLKNSSGRAILAVQQASQQPLVEQLSALKTFIEDLGRIWLDHIITYSQDGIRLEKEQTDPQTGEEYVELVDIPQSVLIKLQATVKVDITPKSAYEKFAQEESIQNLFTNGMFNVERLPELKIYCKLLDDDSVMPKKKIEEAVKMMEEEQQRIAMIQAQAQMMQQRANQFLNSDAEAQSQQIADIENNQQVEEVQEEAVPEEQEEA